MPTSPADLPKLRVMDVFDRAARTHGPKLALRARRNNGWRTYTWSEYHQNVRQTARALIAVGAKQGSGVCIIGYNSPEWFFADIGAIYVGAIPAGIYTTSSPEQCEYIASHCDATVVFVDDQSQLDKFIAIRGNLPALKAIVLMQGETSTPNVYTWSKFLEAGLKTPESEVDRRVAAQNADQVSTLIYTSGTTGTPKAVMLSHDNLTWTAQATVDLLQVMPNDFAVSYLPLSHIAEQITTLHGPMQFGGFVTFAESMEKLGETLRETRPHYFLGVPRVWEKIQERIMSAGAKNPPLRKKIAAWARRIGLVAGYADQQHVSRPFMYPLANA